MHIFSHRLFKDNLFLNITDLKGLCSVIIMNLGQETCAMWIDNMKLY